jgi:CspA family cold shock protein
MRSPSCDKKHSKRKAIRQSADLFRTGWTAYWNCNPAPRRRPARTIGHDRRKSVMAQTGTIKFFNVDKGYGFIKPNDGGRDIFVHITAVEQAGLASLNEGQTITFEVEPDKKGKGPKAVNLHLE